MTLNEKKNEKKQLSKKFWREFENLLPWRRKGIITGDDFATKLLSYLGPEKDLLEIGPGSGRILKSLKKLGGEYATYIGLDIGEFKIKFLKQTLEDSKHHFILGDAEEFSFKQRFDLIFSSATFKHFYPSFGQILQNLSTAMKSSSVLIVDFVEGKKILRYPPFTRFYTKDELITIFDENGFRILKFDSVRHRGAPGKGLNLGGRRLLVVAMLKQEDSL